VATPIPPNAAPFSVAEIAAVTGGIVVASGPDVAGVSTDTRTIRPGNAFVALVGESFDGHRFLEKAVASGATALLVSDSVPAPPGVAVVRVGDTLRALGQLGRHHRDRWGGSGSRTVVAVGGAAGKTTTNRSIAAVLSEGRPGEVHATPGNLNSYVGIPMALLMLEERHRLAVIEVGTNHRGEMAAKMPLVGADVGVLTLIAAEHTEGIGTIDDVAAEEGELFAALPERGLAVGNGDDPRVVEQLRRAPSRHRELYGRSEAARVRLLDRCPVGAAGSRVRVATPWRPEPVWLDVPLLGEAGVYAALAALAVADAVLPVPLAPEAVSRGLARVAGVRDGRLVPVPLADGTVVLDDAYNSNPGSLLASLRAAREVADALGRRLVLVLGEMRELGSLAPSEHDAMGTAAVATRPTALMAVNGEAERFASAARAAGVASEFVATSAEAAERVGAFVKAGDVVLVKGSRGVALEAVVAALVALHGAGPGAEGKEA